MKAGGIFIGLVDDVLGSLHPLDIFGLRPLVAGDDVKTDRLAFVQRLEAVALDRGVMHEDILPRFLDDETKTFLIVEPFDFAAGHTILLIFILSGAETKKDTIAFRNRCLISLQKPHTTQILSHSRDKSHNVKGFVTGWLRLD